MVIRLQVEHLGVGELGHLRSAHAPRPRADARPRISQYVGSSDLTFGCGRRPVRACKSDSDLSGTTKQPTPHTSFGVRSIALLLETLNAMAIGILVEKLSGDESPHETDRQERCLQKEPNEVGRQ